MTKFYVIKYKEMYFQKHYQRAAFVQIMQEATKWTHVAQAILEMRQNHFLKDDYVVIEVTYSEKEVVKGTEVELKA